MKLKQYQVDAFTARVFGGNPAAVCPLEHWLDDALMQAIAGENNLSETAFFVPAADGYQLRWFTPAAEVDLCGHATLATAHVLFEEMHVAVPRISFATRSGVLRVERDGAMLTMDFPALPMLPCDAPAALLDGLGIQPLAVWAGDDYMVLCDSEATVGGLMPDFGRLSQLDRRGVIVMAEGDEVDFVSRFFAPRYGIPEDPVTGSAHCAMAPYWSQRLGKRTLQARQLSRRGGVIACRTEGERVFLSGQAVTFMRAEINIQSQLEER